jgi:hypothetical protein
MRFGLINLAVVFGFAAVASAQPASTLIELFPPGYDYRVTTRVDLKGELWVPVDKDKPPQRVKMTGKAAIDYDERILPVDGQNADQKTFRQYRTIDFQRIMGDRPQNISLRPDVKRLVVLKKNRLKVPFSPDGPLTWGEIDLLRTDIFVPALTGLLPNHAVKPGDTWQISDAAVSELTDMERIERGGLTGKFEQEETISGVKVAHITLAGELQGINEDGPNRQKLTGRLYFDLQKNFINYLSINGEHYLLDKDGRENGKIEGEFVMVRQPAPKNGNLTDAAQAKLVLEPNANNTLLLFEEPELGVRLLYSRRWRVGRVAHGQITLDEANGSGLLVTVEPLARVPAAQSYLKEAQGFLETQKAKLNRINQPVRLQSSPAELDQFSFAAEIGGQRVLMDYLVVRQTNAGATFAARLLEKDQGDLAKEVEQMARSLTLTRKLDTK